jgi:hypothetical protein
MSTGRAEQVLEEENTSRQEGPRGKGSRKSMQNAQAKRKKQMEGRRW